MDRKYRMILPAVTNPLSRSADMHERICPPRSLITSIRTGQTNMIDA